MFTSNCHFTSHLSLIQADLLGDEVVPPTPVNGQPAGTVQSNQDLLAEIFGSSTSISSATTPPTQRSKVDDILNLFGPSGGNQPSTPATPHPSAVTPSYTSPPSSLFTPTQAQAPVVTSQPRLTSYTAYDKNDIKITLTPQTSAARPGVVMILARFQIEMALQPEPQFPTGCSVRSRAFLLSVCLKVKSFAEDHTVHPIIQSRCRRSQVFFLSVHLEVKPFANGHSIVLIVLRILVVMAPQSQSPMSRIIRSQAFVLIVLFKLKSFIFRPVILILDAITLVPALQDAMIHNYTPKPLYCA